MKLYSELRILQLVDGLALILSQIHQLLDYGKHPTKFSGPFGDSLDHSPMLVTEPAVSSAITSGLSAITGMQVLAFTSQPGRHMGH
jgi:hypothetical protein